MRALLSGEGYQLVSTHAAARAEPHAACGTQPAGVRATRRTHGVARAHAAARAEPHTACLVVAFHFLLEAIIVFPENRNVCKEYVNDRRIKMRAAPLF